MYSVLMAKEDQERKSATPHLVREVAYVHRDEAQALVEAAKRERCSKAEIIRRALRAYLKIEI